MSQNVAKLSRYIMKSPVPLWFLTPCTQLHFYAAKTRKSRLNTNSNFTRLQQNIKHQIRRQFFSLFLGFTLSKLFCVCRFCFNGNSSLSSTPRTPQLNTKNPSVPSPSVPHQNLSSSQKPPQFNLPPQFHIKNPSVPHKRHLSSTQPSDKN